MLSLDRQKHIDIYVCVCVFFHTLTYISGSLLWSSVLHLVLTLLCSLFLPSESILSLPLHQFPQ